MLGRLPLSTRVVITTEIQSAAFQYSTFSHLLLTWINISIPKASVRISSSHTSDSLGSLLSIQLWCYMGLSALPVSPALTSEDHLAKDITDIQNNISVKIPATLFYVNHISQVSLCISCVSNHHTCIKSRKKQERYTDTVNIDILEMPPSYFGVQISINNATDLDKF